MYKLAVFDIDGTLTYHKNLIPESTLEALGLLMAKGIHCVIATGRGRKALDEIVKKTGITNFIALNGQYIYYEGEILYKYQYPKEVANKVVEICNKIDCHYGFINDKGYYIPKIEELLKTHKNSILSDKIVIDDHSHEDEINQIVVFCSKERIYEFDELSGNYNFTTWRSDGFDVLVNTKSKATGIKEIAEKLNIDKSEIICFGDGHNDIDMLKYAGMGVAMNNASEEVKEAADYVTDSVENDGIYKALVKLGII